jgi:hypothetical protein
MRFRHKKDNGIIFRHHWYSGRWCCTKCSKKWYPPIVYFALDLELVGASKEEQVEKQLDAALKRKRVKKHAKWAESTPGATILPSILPNWPRWARILFTGGLVGGIGTFLYWWIQWR